MIASARGGNGVIPYFFAHPQINQEGYTPWCDFRLPLELGEFNPHPITPMHPATAASPGQTSPPANTEETSPLPDLALEDEEVIETPEDPEPKDPEPDRLRAIAECTGSSAHLPPSLPPSQSPHPGWTPAPAQ